MTENFSRGGEANKMLEEIYARALTNYRGRHSELPQTIKDEIRRHSQNYPDYTDQILNNIRAADWTIEELRAF